MAADLIRRYSALPAAVISDVLRAAGAPHQVLHHGIAGLDPRRPLVAPAFCVRGERIMGALKASDDRRPEMIGRFPEGAALVLASGGYEPAVVFGENVALALRMKGCAGIVTDGGIRDKRALIDSGMPVFARFVTPLSSGKQWITTGIDVPVTLPGQSSSTVEVRSADLIVADEDGVVVVPHRGLLSILEDAEHVVAIENRTRDQLLAGNPLGEVYERQPRFGHVRTI